jgi:hypothetical protein
MNTVVITPHKRYESKPDGVMPLLWVIGTFAVGTGIQIIAGETGKAIKVMGYRIQGDTAVRGKVIFRYSAVSVELDKIYFPANTADPYMIPNLDSGYFQTALSQGLYIDVITADVNLFLNYIVYTPDL